MPGSACCPGCSRTPARGSRTAAGSARAVRPTFQPICRSPAAMRRAIMPSWMRYASSSVRRSNHCGREILAARPCAPETRRSQPVRRTASSPPRVLVQARAGARRLPRPGRRASWRARSKRSNGRASYADRHHRPAGFWQGNAGGVPQPRRYGRGSVLRAGEGAARSAARGGRGARRAGASVPQAHRSGGARGDAGGGCRRSA